MTNSNIEETASVFITTAPPTFGNPMFGWRYYQTLWDEIIYTNPNLAN